MNILMQFWLNAIKMNFIILPQNLVRFKLKFYFILFILRVVHLIAHIAILIYQKIV